ncbi:DUF2255 family protein [Arthrobacter sp. NEB 688]|uniref:DUF2255 family protein n=1 Tax=Arthrobacter sp. NEB 688 TaxID=904039 RepID=UPI0015632670|nr:DUF2255 family protein [Arthrobacter sp. NEB 688]QKE85147.1 DUF2255 family protein [Arthrobacter sp. NEB 688]
MPDWTTRALHDIGRAEEVQLATRREDGSLRRPRIIWAVINGDRVFIRSTNGVTADWYRAATLTGSGQLVAGRAAHDVTFTHVDDGAALDLADAGYRAKYGRYVSIVDHLEESGPRAATLEVHPA